MIGIIVKILPILSFIVPFFILYLLYPNTFEPVWTGTWENRMGYVLFLWLLFMETIIAWKELQTKKHKLLSTKTVLLILALLLPTIYVIVANYLGVNQAIIELSRKFNIKPAWAALMPLSIEYLIFALLFATIIILKYDVKGIKFYSVSTAFLIIIGVVYTINNLYTFGEFAPFQIMVIPTAIFAEKVLNLMGFKTTLIARNTVPYLYAENPENSRESFGALIDWPCAGVESLMIYTVTILLFLKKLSLKRKIIYFLIGAVVTYFINVLRIVTLYTIAIHKGDWGIFHDYFGPLYSMVWIVSYPLIIVKSQDMWDKFRKWRANKT
ncbi:MAG: exosortase/archaeosortase family protein [Candidatus Bathycorpusculaceae bacterium]